MILHDRYRYKFSVFCHLYSIGNLRLLVAQTPLPEGETNSKGSGVESFFTRPNIFSLPFWVSYLFYIRSDPRLTVSTIITFSLVSCKIMCEFLSTTLVKKSAGMQSITHRCSGRSRRSYTKKQDNGFQCDMTAFL